MPFDFDANANVETLDNVPTEFHAIYAKGADNKFTVNPALKPLVDSYSGMTKAFNAETKLKSNANKEATERRILLKGIKDFAEGLGLTIEDEAKVVDVLATHIADLTGKVKGGEVMKVNLDTVKKQYEKQLAEAVNAEKGETLKMKGSLERHLISEAATAALATSGAISPQLLMPHVKAQVRVVQSGDDFVAAVVDSDGTIRTNGKGSPMTVADLVGEMKTKAEFSVAFKSEAKGGSGVDNKGQSKKTPVAQEDKSPVALIEDGLNALGKR